MMGNLSLRLGASQDEAPRRVLVLGIGNILWGDEGFGVRAVERFHSLYSVPEGVTVLDGGTQGLYLVHFVNEADDLIIFDAIDYGLEPGAMKIVKDAEVPKFTGAKKMSLHQTGFQEVLSAADLMGSYPERLTLIGCQPLDLENWGGPLTEPVQLALDRAVAVAVGILADWGVVCTPRRLEETGEAALLGHDIDHASYERRDPQLATG